MQDAEVADTQILLDGPKRFVHETLVMPGGEKLDWYYVDTPASVMVVPVLPDGQLVMVNQYRHNLKRYTIEFPAGEVAEGETLEVAARRELAEETGFVLAEGGRLRALGAFYSLPSETTKHTHVYIAEPVVSAGPASRDTEIERFFNMSVQITPPGLAVKEIGKSVAGTETITALLLTRDALAR
jgi:ADP-ribose pyrophosphatase